MPIPRHGIAIAAKVFVHNAWAASNITELTAQETSETKAMLSCAAESNPS